MGSLERIKKPTSRFVTKGWDIYSLNPSKNKKQILFENVIAASPSPDKKYLAIVTLNNELFLINLETGQKELVTEYVSTIEDIKHIWNKDSERIAFSKDVVDVPERAVELLVYNVETKEFSVINTKEEQNQHPYFLKWNENPKDAMIDGGKVVTYYQDGKRKENYVFEAGSAPLVEDLSENSIIYLNTATQELFAADLDSFNFKSIYKGDKNSRVYGKFLTNKEVFVKEIRLEFDNDDWKENQLKTVLYDLETNTAKDLPAVSEIGEFLVMRGEGII